MHANGFFPMGNHIEIHQKSDQSKAAEIKEFWGKPLSFFYVVTGRGGA